MRNQRGYLFKKNGAWYGRWRQDELVKDADGVSHVERRQHCEKLVSICDRYRCKGDARPLLDAKLKTLNENRTHPESTLSVCEYTEKYFLPTAERETRPATYNGYRNIWKGYLRAHLEKIKLRDFRCVDATNLLAELHRRHNLGKCTLGHCKTTLSLVFKLAKQQGFLDSMNPVRDAGIPKAAKAGKPTHAYAPQEVQAMLEAVDGVPRLAIGLMFFAGLRPSEARGLKWSDYDSKTKTLHIVRSMWRGHVAECKTASSVGDVPVPGVLADLLDEAPRVSEHILTSAAGMPVDLHNFASRVIRPALGKCAECKKPKHKANGHEYKPVIEWRGFYALRRGCATLATSLDSALAAKSLLRHSNVATTSQYYIKSVPADALRAVHKIDELFARPAADARAN
jgi:integrase